jgi:hypothetical protein
MNLLSMVDHQSTISVKKAIQGDGEKNQGNRHEIFWGIIDQKEQANEIAMCSREGTGHCHRLLKMKHFNTYGVEGGN